MKQKICTLPLFAITFSPELSAQNFVATKNGSVDFPITNYTQTSPTCTNSNDGLQPPYPGHQETILKSQTINNE